MSKYFINIFLMFSLVLIFPHDLSASRFYWKNGKGEMISVEMLFWGMLDTLGDPGGDQGPDADGDGLSDAQELAGGFSTSQPNGITDFQNPDSDGDGFWDGPEVNDGTDPLDPNDNMATRGGGGGPGGPQAQVG